MVSQVKTLSSPDAVNRLASGRESGLNFSSKDLFWFSILIYNLESQVRA